MASVSHSDERGGSTRSEVGLLASTRAREARGEPQERSAGCRPCGNLGIHRQPVGARRARDQRPRAASPGEVLRGARGVLHESADDGRGAARSCSRRRRSSRACRLGCGTGSRPSSWRRARRRATYTASMSAASTAAMVALSVRGSGNGQFSPFRRSLTRPAGCLGCFSAGNGRKTE